MFRLAPVLADLGDRPGAAALLASARQLLTSAPAGADAQLARLDRLERLIAGRRAVLAGEALTEREVAVLQLLRGSLTLRGIAQELHVSQNTIKTHVRAIYRKLGVSNRSEAVTKGRDAGLL